MPPTSHNERPVIAGLTCPYTAGTEACADVPFCVLRLPTAESVLCERYGVSLTGTPRGYPSLAFGVTFWDTSRTLGRDTDRFGVIQTMLWRPPLCVVLGAPAGRSASMLRTPNSITLKR